MYLVRDFYFESAHHLINYNGKCKNLHGHSYRMQVTIKSEIKSNGMVMDFGDLKKLINENIIDLLDHANLNDYIEQPTVENLCIYIWRKLSDKLPLYEIKIWETRDSFAYYRGENEGK